MGGELTQDEISKTVDFCLNAFQPTAPEDAEAVMRKMERINDQAAQASASTDGKTGEKGEEPQETLTADELRVLKSIQARQMLRTEDGLHINNFATDVIDGMAPMVKRGSLGLIKATASEVALDKPAVMIV